MATQWFCRVGGKVLGPMPGEELIKKVRTGAVKAATQIRKNDSPWFPAEEVNGLFETAFRAAHA